MKFQFFLQFQLLGPRKLKRAIRPIKHLDFSYFSKFSGKLERTSFEENASKYGHSTMTTMDTLQCSKKKPLFAKFLNSSDRDLHFLNEKNILDNY